MAEAAAARCPIEPCFVPPRILRTHAGLALENPPALTVTHQRPCALVMGDQSGRERWRKMERIPPPCVRRDDEVGSLRD